VASSDRTQNGIGGGSGPAVVLGSFAALQRRIRQEQETVERLVGERIEAHIAAMVADQLRARKREIHREVLVKVDRARQNMEAEVQLEIELMKKFRAKEQERRLAELQARMAEDDRQVEEEKRKLAEERLQILESQVPTVPYPIGNVADP
jgi:exonuclease VII large subunit